jgi:hypothetical protein
VQAAPAGRSLLARLDRAAGGLAADLILYLVSAGFALFTALTATLPPHGAWGRIAAPAYGVAALIVLVQLGIGWSGIRLRAIVTGLAWAGACLVPLVVEAVQRAGGRTDRAQEEVIVVENAGIRLLHTGTPYLSHDAIAALPADQRIFGYLPYQPAMALFGLPRAVLGTAWYTDARVWFALATAAALALCARLLLRAEVHLPSLVRAVQAATVLPLCALTLAVGGDDLPILALCLLALCYAAVGRPGAAGLAVGIAGAMKLFAWPVALVLLALVPPGRRLRYALGALGLPALSLIPAFLVDPDSAVENVIRFPLGKGLVHSPAESPFPGHLIAAGLPGGTAIAAALLVLAALGIGWWLIRRRPPDASAAALVCTVAMLAITLLLPSTRFGYLLYPAAFALWAPALRLPPGSANGRPGTAVGSTLEQ